jgi:hypothetical protein
MEIRKNKKTGEYFIQIEEKDNKKRFLGVTPLGEVKLLNAALFEDAIDIDEGDVDCNALLHQIQIQKFHEYLENRKEDSIEYILGIYERMSQHEKKRFIELLEASGVQGVGNLLESAT